MLISNAHEKLIKHLASPKKFSGMPDRAVQLIGGFAMIKGKALFPHSSRLMTYVYREIALFLKPIPVKSSQRSGVVIILAIGPEFLVGISEIRLLRERKVKRCPLLEDYRENLPGSAEKTRENPGKHN